MELVQVGEVVKVPDMSIALAAAGSNPGVVDVADIGAWHISA